MTTKYSNQRLWPQKILSGIGRYHTSSFQFPRWSTPNMHEYFFACSSSLHAFIKTITSGKHVWGWIKVDPRLPDAQLWGIVVRSWKYLAHLFAAFGMQSAVGSMYHIHHMLWEPNASPLINYSCQSFQTHTEAKAGTSPSLRYWNHYSFPFVDSGLQNFNHKQT